MYFGCPGSCCLSNVYNLFTSVVFQGSCNATDLFCSLESHSVPISYHSTELIPDQKMTRAETDGVRLRQKTGKVQLDVWSWNPAFWFVTSSSIFARGLLHAWSSCNSYPPHTMTHQRAGRAHASWFRGCQCSPSQTFSMDSSIDDLGTASHFGRLSIRSWHPGKGPISQLCGGIVLEIWYR